MCKIRSLMNTKNNLAETKMEKKKKQALITMQQKTKHLGTALSRQVLIYMKKTINSLERLERLS